MIVSATPRCFLCDTSSALEGFKRGKRWGGGVDLVAIYRSANMTTCHVIRTLTKMAVFILDILK